MNVRTVNTVEGFKALEPAWRDLHEQSPEASFFNGFDFAFVWWQFYGSLGDLCIDVVESESAGVVAIAPLYKTKSQLTRLFKLPTLRFVGRGGDVTPDDLNVLLSPNESDASDAVAKLQAAWNQYRGAHRILLEDMPETSRFFQLCRQHAGYRIEHRESRLMAALPTTWQDFNANVSRNTRKRIKNRRNRLRDANTLSLALCDTKESMRSALAALVRLHQDRFHSKGDTPAFSSAEYIGFHETLLDVLYDKKGLQFVTLSDGDSIVGVEYMYAFNNRLLFNQTGFDPAYEKVSPGHNMMAFAIENAIASGFQFIDLLKGDYAYKQSYAATRVNSITASHYPSRFWRCVAGLLQLAKSR